MKPNFHAIEAIAFGLRYGFQGLPTFFRLGWLPLLLLGLATFLLIDAGVDFSPSSTGVEVAQTDDAAGGWGGVMAAGQTWEIDPEDLSPAVFGAGALGLAALFLFIPATVALTREAAGMEPRGGFLPAFGKAEISYLASVLLLALIIILLSLAVIVPLVMAGYLTDGDAGGPIIAIVLVLFALFMIWFVVRFSLLPTYAALTGQIALGRAFHLTSGRFWKLLGTLLLFAVIFGIIGFLFDMVGLAVAAFELTLLMVLLSTVFQIYQSVAQTGFMARIAHDLMATREQRADVTGS